MAQDQGDVMAKKIRATARVRVTIEVANAGGTWGEGCSIEQLFQQAKESALATIQNLIHPTRTDLHIIGDPVVTGVIVEEG